MTTITTDFSTFLQKCRTRVDTVLDHYLPIADRDPTPLSRAMRYAALNGGKRLRAACVYITGHATNADTAAIDRIAAAIECLHAYSLVHDDLPAMDNADLRRGQPSCHRAFGEATAILVGDGLQALAFRILADIHTLPATRIVAILRVFSQAVGLDGMVGGQAYDLWAEGRTLSLTALETLHRAKTGALIQASLQLGAMAQPKTAPQVLQQLERFGLKLGLAFQIKDDLLDAQGDTTTLGKVAGQDLQQLKSTYVQLLGVDGATEKMLACIDSAFIDLLPLGKNFSPLRALCTYATSRDS